MVSTLRDLRRLLIRCKKEGPTALDFETTAFTPDEGRVRLVSLCNKKLHALVDFDRIKGGFKKCAPFFEGKYASWVVFHAGFEQRWFKAAGAEDVRCLDVGNLRRAILGGGGYSLKQIAAWDLDVEMDKEEQSSNWGAKHLTQAQLDYAYLDADITWRLWRHWADKADEGHWKGFAMFNDMVPAVIEMETSGMLLDVKTHQTLVDNWKIVQAKRIKRVRKLVGEDEVANINSDTQWSDYFAAHMPDDFLAAWPRTEKTGQLSMANDTLKMLAGWVPGTPLEKFFDALSEYKTISKYLSSFGETLITKAELDPARRVHARFNIGAAKTGRFCVAGDTLVDTVTGPLRIDECVPGTLVRTHLGKYRPVLHLIYKGKEQLYKVSTQGDTYVRCTLRHRLLTDAGWKTVEEIREYGSQCEAPNGRGVVPQGCGRVLEANHALVPRLGQNVWDQYTYRAGNAASRIVRGEAQVGAWEASGRNEAGSRQPHVWQVRGTAPQLQGGVRGRLRISDPEGWPEAALYASHCDVENAGYLSGGVTDVLDRLSFRREPTQQRRGQSMPHDGWSAYAYPLTITRTGAGPGGVWDIEVAEDHSYTAGGLVHHNSSSGPNLQQMPRDRDLLGVATSVRSSFVAGLGRRLVSLDYSGIELRVLALLSGDEQLLQDVVEGDVHSEVAAVIAGHPIDKTTRAGKAARQAAKGVSFGIIYGSGAGGLATTMRTSLGNAQLYIDFWENRYPDAFQLRYDMMAEVESTRYIRMVDGGTVYMGKRADLPKCANYPVQRGALSVMARAIVRHKATLDRVRSVKTQRMTRMLSTIHDALIDEAASKDARECLKLMEQDMTKGYLDIFPGAPTDRLVEGGIGPNWGQLG